MRQRGVEARRRVGLERYRVERGKGLGGDGNGEGEELGICGEGLEGGLEGRRGWTSGSVVLGGSVW